MHPDRPKLGDLVAEELRRGFANQRWNESLPQERVLAAELKVSRATLRMALAVMQREGRLRVVPRRGAEIIGSRPRRSPQKMQAKCAINLLLPGAADEIRPTAVSWVDELRAILAARGWLLRIIESKACYLRHPETALASLSARNPADCWLVRLSTRAMQQWFQRTGTPVVLAGTRHAEIELPYVDVDHRALSRHATGTVLNAGHRRLLLLVDEDGKAGDLETERGFLEACQSRPQVQITALVARHDGTVAGVIKHLERALRRGSSPTAILVSQGMFCLTVWTYLAARGIRIPQDISLVTQIGSSYLSYLYPEPASYRINQRKYARTILAALVRAMGKSGSKTAHLVLPEFVRGASLARRSANEGGR